MLYEKKVKYLDYLEKGMRVKGGGFIKLEVRDGNLQVELSIAGLHHTDTFTRELLLCSRDREGSVGKIEIVSGRGQYRQKWRRLENIGGTGIDYGELCGVRIPLGAGREISGRWEEARLGEKKVPAGNHAVENSIHTKTEDGKRLAVEKTVANGKRGAIEEEAGAAAGTAAVWQENEAYHLEVDIQGQETAQKDTKDGSPVEEIASREEQTMKETGPVKALSGENFVDVIVTSRDEGDPRKDYKEEMHSADSSMEERLFGDNRAELQESSMEVREEQTGWRDRAMADSGKLAWRSGKAGREYKDTKSDRHQAGSHSQEPARKKPDEPERKSMPAKPMEEKWSQLWAIYPHIRPFQDAREYLSIRPSDFVLFPETSYKAVNNSFLLHGYYNYHHLLLARVERRGEYFYYIGVPGNFYEREKQVAIMFGFESFECAEEPAQAGDFGYYMMRTQI